MQPRGSSQIWIHILMAAFLLDSLRMIRAVEDTDGYLDFFDEFTSNYTADQLHDEQITTTNSTTDDDNFVEMTEVTMQNISSSEEYVTESATVVSIVLEDLEVAGTTSALDGEMEIQQKSHELETFHELMSQKVKAFVNTLEVDVGEGAMNETHTYVQELEEFLVKYKLLNENGSSEKEVDAVDFYDVKTYETMLNIEKDMEVALEELSVLHLKFSHISTHKHEFDNLTCEWIPLTLRRNLADKDRELELVKNLSYSARNLHQFIERHNLSDILLGNRTLSLLDLTYYESMLPTLQEEKRMGEEMLAVADHLMYDVDPVITGVMLALQIICNGLLFVVFTRHQEMRTGWNLLLINLGFGEMLSNIVSSPIKHIYLSTGETTDSVCKAFTFFRVVGLGVSAYSLVAISIQRYVVLAQLLEGCGHQIGRKRSLFLVLVAVWAVGAILAAPYTVHSEAVDGHCLTGYHGQGRDLLVVTLIGLLGICVVPLILTSVFVMLSSAYLNNGPKHMSIGRKVKKRLKPVSVLSTLAMAILCFIFTVCYMPSYLFDFLRFGVNVQVKTVTCYYASMITYDLRFINFCLGITMLYVISYKYRHYFNKYILCRKLSGNVDSSFENMNKSSTSIDTRL
ncbi:uncharacterized protein [Periplaneta americana]|uniref:uncharacterized protein n=1 Tax=Periplaneta americana TaxID=6978 RepID=UPI0037E79B55